MTPAGYMAKRVAKRPERIRAPGVRDVYSLCGCISEHFADYAGYRKHNRYRLFDSVDALRSLAREHSIPIEDCRIFYYEVFEKEYDDENIEWRAFAPDKGFVTSVIPSRSKRLEGFDVVAFSACASPECSPLSCNNLATAIRTNEHCLFSSFEDAKARLEAGDFEASGPGPFRIFAVYSVAE